MKTEESSVQKTASDGGLERGGVLWVGIADIGLPLAPSLKKRYGLIAEYAPHFVVGYHPGYRFRRFTDEVQFYLAPRALPFPLRVSVFAIWTWLVTAYLVWFRQVRVLVAQSPYEGFLLWLVRGALRLSGRRLVLVVQVQGFSEEVVSLAHPFLRHIRFLWQGPLRWAIRRADLVRAVSGSTERYVQSLGPRQVFVFPTWSNWELFLEAPTEGTRDPAEAFHLLYVGSLTPVKGVDVLLEAVAQLRRKGYDIKLTVTGDGPYRGTYEEMARRLGIADVVSWTGLVPLEKVKELMDACAAFVFPSRTEGLARVLVEAGACGKPVVATAVGGIPEVVEDGRTGILVSPGDPDAVAHGVEYLIQHPEEARAMGERGREIVAQRYGTQAWLVGYSAILEAAWEKLGRA